MKANKLCMYGFSSDGKILNYQISADRFVLNLKIWKNSRCHFPIGILLLVVREEEIAWHLGPFPIWIVPVFLPVDPADDLHNTILVPK